MEQAIACIKAFNPIYSTVDSHADTFLATVTIHLLVDPCDLV